ncbi:MAG TPA: peptide ABC transporter substrate-binding protein, partial [Pyrinomonadaceae bacterium]|nr:peptide ABC transporter substrate-binding protein [Pyrinomonadaceae bacterium]
MVRTLSAFVAFTLLCVACVGCATGSAGNFQFFGKVRPPAQQVMRYISGSEPESLDPQLSTGQPEARIFMALYEGLVEFNPKTMEPIPAVAQRWELSENAAEYVFHLRPDARWSDGEKITAADFVYSLQRGLRPDLASRSAYMAYYIKYAKGYNENAAFVRDPRSGEFLLEKDFQTDFFAPPTAPSSAAETAFHRFISGPTRLVVPGDEKGRARAAEKNPKLKEAFAGKEFVPVRAEDVGIEAVDEMTLRVTLTQPAPFFLGMMGHQFFKAVPRRTIEKHGALWTQPQNIVCSGAFKLQTWKPYNELILVRNSHYWDAANVKLDRLIFYPMEDSTTMLNLYKAGEVDAMYNHTVPTGWIDYVSKYKDYMDAPESAITYIMVNTQHAPMNDIRVRQAFSLAIDREALAQYQKAAKPLYAFTPEGIFPHYPQPKGTVFDPAKAKQLLVEAGYHDEAGRYDSRKFPAGQVEYTYNTVERNREVAEFLQAQWKQNLGITVNLN